MSETTTTLNIDGMIPLKRYFMRVGICWKWESPKMLPRCKSSLFKLLESLMNLLCDTCYVFIFILQIVFQLPIVIWRCFFSPLKYGAKIEEKLT